MFQEVHSFKLNEKVPLKCHALLSTQFYDVSYHPEVKRQNNETNSTKRQKETIFADIEVAPTATSEHNLMPLKIECTKPIIG